MVNALMPGSKKMRIIFMGSDFFASKILSELAQVHNIVAIYTANHNNNRSRNARINSVLDIAAALSIVPKTISKFTEADISSLIAMSFDIIVIAAYGLLIPKKLIEYCKHRPLCIHPSLLPRWRGAAPLERALEAGDEETGVSIMEIVEKLDAGDILNQSKIAIYSDMTIEELYIACAKNGIEMLLKTLNEIQSGTVKRFNQSDDRYRNIEHSYAKKISKDELMIDWNLDVLVINRKIRAFALAGGCYFIWRGLRIKILSAHYRISSGTFNHDINESNFTNGEIACRNGYIIPKIMQREGKMRMSAQDVFRGLLR